jgi:hypothetical protein
MFRPPIRWLSPALFIAIAWAPAAIAQDRSPAAAAADPLDAGASVPTVVYRSNLAGYRRLGNDKPIPWREANETVGRIGGWRAYAREANEPASAERPATGASAPDGSMPSGHDGHRTEEPRR